MALTWHLKEYWQCNILVFMETWLNSLITETTIALMDLWLEERRGAGSFFFIWMIDGVTLGKSLLKSNAAVKTLVMCMRPCYLPWEFSQAIVMAVYIPNSSSTDAACDIIHSMTCRLQTQNPQALLLISRDFNHASLASTLPTFIKYIKCSTKIIKHGIYFVPTLRRHITTPVFKIPHCGMNERNYLNCPDQLIYYLLTFEIVLIYMLILMLIPCFHATI